MLSLVYTVVPSPEAESLEILYLLIPLAVVLAGLMVAAFIYSVKSGQFDDLEGPGHRILMDDDDPRIPEYQPKRKKRDLSKPK